MFNIDPEKLKTFAEERNKNPNNKKPEFRPPKDLPYRHQVQKVEEDTEVDLELVLRRVALFMGIFVAIISIVFSYDGFDNSVTGGNPAYSTWAKIIGFVLACAVTVLQFVFSSAFSKLNTTLKFFGIMSYAYSMYTNYLGITNILHMEPMMAGIATLFMDGVPEPLIAWSLGASLRGDFLGNLLKTFFSATKPSEKKKYSYDVRDDFRDKLGH